MNLRSLAGSGATAILVALLVAMLIDQQLG